MGYGLGKTSTVLAALKILKSKGMFHRALIVAPKRVCTDVWPVELGKWRDFADLKMTVLTGLVEKRREAALQECADIFVINPEGLQWLLNVEKTSTTKKIRDPSTREIVGEVAGKTKVAANLKRFKSLGFDILIVDELTGFKHTSSQRFKALSQVLHLFARRWGLTGKPAPNGLEDLFGQCFILDMGRSLGAYITHYRRAYFEQNLSGFGWSLRDGCEKQIYKKLEPLMLTMSTDNYLDLPPLATNDIYLELPETVRDVYKKMERDLIAQIEDRTVTAASCGVAAMKCRQIVSGAVYSSPDMVSLFKPPPGVRRETIDIHTVKIDVLGELVEELQDSPLLLPLEFEFEFGRVIKKFPQAVVLGRSSEKRDSQIIRDWNLGSIPILVGHPRAIGMGLNLQGACCNIAWHTLPWDLELYEQLIARVRRQGNTALRIMMHRLIMLRTIDEHVAVALSDKDRVQTSLLKALGAKRK